MKTNVISIILCICCFGAQAQQMLFPVFEPVQDDQKYGYIDASGKVVVPFQYDDAKDFTEGLAAVRKNGFYGFINLKGELVIPCEYDHVCGFSEGYAFARYQDKEYFISRENKRIEIDKRPVDNYSLHLRDGMYPAVIGGKKGMADVNGKMIIPASYYDLGQGFSEKKMWVKDDYHGTPYYIDQSNQKKLEIRYRATGNFYHGLARCSNDDFDWGFMNEKGEMVIPHQFKMVGDFYPEGYAHFYNEDYQYGLIDRTGKIRMQPKSYEKIVFSEGFAMISHSGGLDLVDKDLNVVKTFDGYSGVGTGNVFRQGLCLIHINYEDKNHQNQNIRDWGGVVSAYINTKGDIIWQSKPWYSCFPQGSMVTMADYSEQAIETVQQGDRILSFDPATHQWKETIVDKVRFHNGQFDLITVSYQLSGELASSNGGNSTFSNQFQATANHPVLTDNGYVPAGDLKTGDLILVWNSMRQQSEWIEIGSVEHGSSAEVYNLKTMDENYVVNGIVVKRK